MEVRPLPLQQIAVLNDLEARVTHERRVLHPNRIPVMAYDNDHYDRWNRWVERNEVGDKTLYTLHTVGPNDVPFRWIVSIAETAQMIEGLAEHGVKPPHQWQLMAPFHINTAVNNGDLAKAQEQAVKLEAFARGYVETFHPQAAKLSGLPVLQPDGPEWVDPLLEYGEKVYPLLDRPVKEDLHRMASKHANGNEDEEVLREGIPDTTVAAYLMAHFSGYGLVNGHFPHGFKQNNALFVVPASEDRFLSMVEQSRNAVETLGVKVSTHEDQNSVIMVSQILRTPHYYPHKGESLLSKTAHQPDWPTAKKVRQQKGMNGLAQNEVMNAVTFIEEDIGGTIQDRERFMKLVRAILYEKPKK